MSNLRKIIAWISAFAIIIFALCIPAFATSGSQYDQKVGFWDWAVQYCPLKDLLGYTAGLGSCVSSEDGYHHANSYQADLGDGTYKCICTYCGHSFTAYESDLKQSYDNQVDSLPATNINSAGLASFYLTGWTYEISDLSSCLIVSSLSDYPCVDSYDPNARRTVVSGTSGSFTVPVSGEYKIVFPASEVSALYSNTSLNEKIYLFGGGYDSFSLGKSVEGFSCNVVLSAGDLYLIKGDFCAGSFDDVKGGLCSYRIYRPYIAGSRSLFSGSTPDSYNITTRPTAITGGNYGIVGDDGTINTVTNNNKIVNETNNTYYNPATGQTSTITDWSYNYENRTYDITLDTGDKVSVEYGDQNITITENNVVEGDTIVNNYTIYYIIDGSGSGDNPTSAPTACVHDWYESSRTDPTCTAPGKVTYTCSQCGVTRAETLPALGHDWEVVRTVSTEYDEDGVLIQEGYTLYECTRCGEQYKDADSTGPPDGSVNDGGLIEWLNGLIKSLSDNLSGAVDLILRFFREIPQMFSGFLEFLSAMFPYLPDEVIFLFTFGIAALVIIGVIKAIRR